MITGHLEESMRIIRESVKSLDPDTYGRLVEESLETLRNGGKIIASGLGKNVPVCEKFVGSMVSLGLNAAFMNTNSAVHGDIGMVKDEDLVIVLTKSGETIESVHLVAHLKERQCKVWLLSFNPDSTLSREVKDHICLSLEHEGDPWNIMPIHSTTVNHIVLQDLSMLLAKEMNVKLHEFKLNHPGGAIGESLKDA